jgi:hypothetical protein
VSEDSQEPGEDSSKRLLSQYVGVLRALGELLGEVHTHLATSTEAGVRFAVAPWWAGVVLDVDATDVAPLAAEWRLDDEYLEAVLRTWRTAAYGLAQPNFLSFGRVRPSTHQERRASMNA